MHHLNRRDFLGASLLAAGSLALPKPGFGAVNPAVETVVAPLLTGEERNAQPDIWALEVRFKPVRMLEVDLRDPATGRSGRQLVWYLAYRAVVRPSSRVPDATESSEERPLFVPEFALVTDNQGRSQTYPDRVLPAAQAAINKRERHPYKNSVEIVAPLPKVTPDASKTLNSLDGLATWIGVDPDADFFAIYMSGFSNGYKIEKGPDGQEIVLRRGLVQRFWRPSDRFDQSEEEIRLKDEAKWLYR